MSTPAAENGETEKAPSSKDDAAPPTMGAAAVLSMFAAVTTIAVSLVRSKVTAVVLGDEGVGTTSVLLQPFQLLAVPLGMTTGPAYTSALAESFRDGDVARAQRTYDTAATIVVAGGTLVATVGVAFAYATIPSGVGATHIALLPFAGLYAVGLALATVPVRALVAAQRLHASTRVTTTANVLGGVLVVGGTIAFGLSGQLVALGLYPLVGFVVGMTAVGTIKGLRRIPRPRFDREFARHVASLGVVSLIGGFATQGALTAIRYTLEARGGVAWNGQFQAAWAISAVYFQTVLGSLGAYVFPRFAAATDAAALTKEVDDATTFVLRVAPPVILLGIALRGYAMTVLYSHEFDAAAENVGFQMAGDLAKALSWIQAGPLPYRRRVRAFFVTESVGALMQGGFAVLLIPRFGLLGCAFGYVATYVLYMLMTAVVLRRECQVPIRKTRLGLVLLFTAAAIGAMVATQHYPWVSYVLVAIAVTWLIRAGVVKSVLDKIKRKLGR